MILSNIILPFTICDNNVKGRIIKLDEELDKILTQHQYPELVAKLLGELLLITAIIGSQFKDEITLTLQLQTEGYIKYMVADYQSPNQVKGYVQIDSQQDFKTELDQDFITKGFLTITIDRKIYDNHRYQGVIEVENINISQVIEKYFEQSEQIPTLVKLAVGRNLAYNQKTSWCGGGIMIQKLPNAEDQEKWIEAQAYFMTIRDHELIDPSISTEKLLYSLYHEVGVTIYDYLPIVNKCRCSRERAIQVLKAIGEEEIESLIVDGKISVKCQFCNQSQDFLIKEVKKMFD